MAFNTIIKLQLYYFNIHNTSEKLVLIFIDYRIINTRLLITLKHTINKTESSLVILIYIKIKL